LHYHPTIDRVNTLEEREEKNFGYTIRKVQYIPESQRVRSIFHCICII
jgi:hypothetical protein